MEEAPATPGWVEERLDEILALYPLGAAGADCRAAYLACLAECRGNLDPEAGHDRCRAAFLNCLRGRGLDIRLDVLADELERLEAEITDLT